VTIDLTREADFSDLFAITTPIEHIELLRFDCLVPRHFSFGSWHNRQHGVLRLSSGGHSGLAEDMLSSNQPDMVLAQKGEVFRELDGMTIGQALRGAYEGTLALKDAHREMAEIALLDLAGRLQERPALEMLGLHTTGYVNGTPSILSDDPEKVRREAAMHRERGYTANLKIKLFGKPELDRTLVATARSMMAPGSYLSGDVNSGYGKTSEGVRVSDLAVSLRHLHDLGLDGCEDPAEMPVADWVALQALVLPQDLIPDVVLRPARSSRLTVVAGMGRKFNIHPGCTSGLLQAIQLGRRICALGAQLVIGDNSLIGPACNFWQQLAIGFGAGWCEAVEKPEDTEDFLRCITHRPVTLQSGGRLGLTGLRPGFGLGVDEAAMRRSAKAILILR